MKIITQIIMLLLVVHIAVVYAQQPVIITVIKDVIEDDLDSFNLYNGEDVIANIKSDIKPWIWQGEITLDNGKAIISATALDTTGNESEKSPPVVFDPVAPTSPSLTIIIINSPPGQ
jgi:hypothetical protein